MFFCPICGHTYDIIKPGAEAQIGGKKDGDVDSPLTVVTDSVQTGENWDDIVIKVLNKEDVTQSMITILDLETLKKSSEYKKLSKKLKEFVYNKLYELLPVEQKIQKELTDIKSNLSFMTKLDCGGYGIMKTYIIKSYVMMLRF